MEHIPYIENHCQMVSFSSSTANGLFYIQLEFPIPSICVVNSAFICCVLAALAFTLPFDGCFGKYNTDPKKDIRPILLFLFDKTFARPIHIGAH